MLSLSERLRGQLFAFSQLSIFVTVPFVDPLNPEEVRRAVQIALAEDIGSGDVTTQAIVPETAIAKAIIAGREPQQNTVPSIAQAQAPTGGVSEPVVVYKVQPGYTPEAKEARIQGIVIISATVREDGTVKVERIVQSLGYGLDEAAAAAQRSDGEDPDSKTGARAKAGASQAEDRAEAAARARGPTAAHGISGREAGQESKAGISAPG